jgi:putative lipoprotein
VPDLVSGHYVWGGEVNVFTPCGSAQDYWVTADPEVLRVLRAQYTSFQLPPYAPVFAELRGTVGPVLDCGFCQEYDGSFEVTELVRMSSLEAGDCAADADAAPAMGRAPTEGAPTPRAGGSR